METGGVMLPLPFSITGSFVPGTEPALRPSMSASRSCPVRDRGARVIRVIAAPDRLEYDGARSYRQRPINPE